MGAVTALLYAPSDRNLAGMILDSPFSDFNELMREVAKSYVPVLPEFVANYLVGLLRETVLEKAGFDICGIVPFR
jgi:alpha-beta hydrolase superfamily lysophospholipase